MLGTNENVVGRKISCKGVWIEGRKLCSRVLKTLDFDKVITVYYKM